MPSSTDIQVPADLVRPRVPLAGEDGNAFAILGRVRRALRRAGNSKDVMDSYMQQATAGDYDRLLAVSVAFVDEGPEVDDATWDADDEE